MPTFVTFIFNKDGLTGTGNAKASQPIETWEDVELVKRLIEEKNDVTNVVITNFIPLKD